MAKPGDWQRALRRQFGSEQAFEWQNLGDAHLAPVFSQFMVGNVASGGRYRVDIRGDQPGGQPVHLPRLRHQ